MVQTLGRPLKSIKMMAGSEARMQRLDKFDYFRRICKVPSKVKTVSYSTKVKRCYRYGSERRVDGGSQMNKSMKTLQQLCHYYIIQRVN